MTRKALQKIEESYLQFLENKVSEGRADLAAGKVVSAEETERLFSARRQIALKQWQPSQAN
ncbi:hypothetical protein [Peteryoungia ipomoeae]|uniref:Uncharacterized protein n=1 Tax=Peteryoungia ipomoeae TaxID=1210932 RepID=A0A4S8NZT3_9HYPH|nr:hypothetical protein [Peteryoungia ipomoeae]THV23277.1 hypothetical protein FAA97_11765 [Peteryoungia ipomoeae]